MAFDIKQIAIALGCAATIAFVVGRFNSGSDSSGYEPVTPLAQLDQSEIDVADPSESVAIADAKRLPGQLPGQEDLGDLASAVESDSQILFSDSELLDPAELASEMFAIELPGENSVEIPAPVPTPFDAPASDSVTEQGIQPTELPTAELPSQPRASGGINWKTNPYISTSTPAFTPVDEKSTSEVQPASMTVENQSVRSLNDIPGIQSAAPAAAEASKRSARPGKPDDATSDIAPISISLSESAAQKAVHHIEYGKSLTRRGATFAARHEFFSALRVIAESNDARINGNDFSLALSKAIRAMTEAEDFSVTDSLSGAVVDVPATIEAHRTKLLTQQQARRTTPLNAMKQYFAYAGQQLDFAGGRNVVTAEALHCLGKLHSVLSSQKPTDSNSLDIAKAIVFHRSSLLSNSNNPASANELGVLMAKSGNLQEATSLFKQSLIAQATPQAWSNLAKTHNRMGDQQMAQMAQAEIGIAAQSTSIATAGIQWIQTPEFNAMAPMEFEPRVAQKATPVALPKAEANETEEEEPDASIAQRIKDWF